MVLIPAGSFRMGDLTGTGYDREKPVHKVTISRPFLMSRLEVTQELYESVMGSNPSHFKGAKLPVEKVSWNDAVEFCNALSRKEGLKPCYSGKGKDVVCDFSANGYRLPTEAEWEFAARAGTDTDFHNGKMKHAGKTPLDPVLGRSGWYEGNAGRKSHPVGGKEANAFGLHDMHGNVAEWCWDFYSAKYYNESPSKDPRGPVKGPRRILRGGGWYSDAKGCRSAFRVGSMPEFTDYYNGIRLVRTQ
jgi:formylglycine-generating enzyme required for sulfatase activity